MKIYDIPFNEIHYFNKIKLDELKKIMKYENPDESYNFEDYIKYKSRMFENMNFLLYFEGNKLMGKLEYNDFILNPVLIKKYIYNHSKLARPKNVLKDYKGTSIAVTFFNYFYPVIGSEKVWKFFITLNKPHLVGTKKV